MLGPRRHAILEKTAVASDTGYLYSIGSARQETAMRSAHIRLVYRPSPDRLPRWVYRVWAWF
jgi:hypothetical protein